MTTSTGVNTGAVKQMNKKVVFECLRDNASLTKVAITAMTGLSFATVTNLLTEMMAQELVVELGMADSSGGRKAVLYGINPRAHVFLGVDVRVNEILCVMADLTGKVVHEYAEEFDAKEGPHAAVLSIEAIVRKILELTGTSFERIAGVGISTPGPIDDEHGVITSPPNLTGWKNVPFLSMVSQSLGVPCYLEKDANAAALGESWFGAGQDVNNLVYIMADVGIGGGLIIHGEVFKGFLNGAGEIGQMIVEYQPSTKEAGSSCHLVDIASGRAIEQRIFETDGDAPKLKSILQSPGDETYAEYLAEAGNYLGIAIGSVCNLLNPAMVIVGGGLAENDLYFETAVRYARQYMISDYAYRIRIERATLGEFASATGAAMIAFNHWLYK